MASFRQDFTDDLDAIRTLMSWMDSVSVTVAALLAVALLILVWVR
jgi:hypothetical protein